MTVLRPKDPRAITDPDELEAARKNTEKWRDRLGLPRPSAAEKARYERDLTAILDLIGYDEGGDA
ncbi:MAG TPA: hypothetical protein VH482_17365 [Thermomicrobiales bacterium]|jgi:hypothetical protein